jgi:STIP1 family protein 1
MEQWEAVVADCERAIELLPSSSGPLHALKRRPEDVANPRAVKAYTYLGSALLHLNRPDESFKASHKAYLLAIEYRSPSIPQIAASCLEAKKKRWELAESERIKRESMLLRDTMAMIERDALERSRRVGGDQGKEIEEEAVRKCRQLEEVFGKAEAETLRKRIVPDWLIDNITFGVMWDPVMVGPLCTLVETDADFSAHHRPKTDIPMIAQPCMTICDAARQIRLRASR